MTENNECTYLVRYNLEEPSPVTGVTMQIFIQLLFNQNGDMIGDEWELTTTTPTILERSLDQARGVVSYTRKADTDDRE